MPRILKQEYTLSAGATRTVWVNCSKELADDVSLTGTPTVTEQGTSDLTIPDGDKTITTSSYTCKASKSTVPAGQGIYFSVAGGSAGAQHRIRVSCSTDSSPAETLVYDIIISWT